jgi:hypothetical protein
LNLDIIKISKMKYFALSAALALSANADIEAEINKCSKAINENSTASDYINSQVLNFVSGVAAKTDNYYIKYKAYNGGQSTFVTVTCRYAPWQSNGHPNSPYEDGRHWNRTVAEANNYLQYKDDREALKIWHAANGGTDKWPAKSGGRFRCGYKNENGVSTRAWRQLKPIPVCPNRKEVGATVDFVDPKGECYADVPERRDLSGTAVQFKWDQITTTSGIQACKDYCKTLNFFYAAVQNGDECWCDNSFGSYGKSNGCLKPCKDLDKKGTCGGPSANQVYLSGYKN